MRNCLPGPTRSDLSSSAYLRSTDDGKHVGASLNIDETYSVCWLGVSVRRYQGIVNSTTMRASIYLVRNQGVA